MDSQERFIPGTITCDRQNCQFWLRRFTEPDVDLFAPSSLTSRCSPLLFWCSVSRLVTGIWNAALSASNLGETAVLDPDHYAHLSNRIHDVVREDTHIVVDR